MRQLTHCGAIDSQLTPNLANAQGVALPKGKSKHEEFGRRVKYYMSVRGITAATLMKKLGVKEGSTISRWRGGRMMPEGEDLLKLAQVLGVDVNLLSPGFAPPEALAPRGVIVLGEARYSVPYGARVRQAIESLDISTVPPAHVRHLAEMEVGDAERHGEPMTAKRILWWVEQAFLAGQRSATTAAPLIRSAHAATSLPSDEQIEAETLAPPEPDPAQPLGQKRPGRGKG